MEEGFSQDQNNSSFVKSSIGLQEDKDEFTRKSRPVIGVNESILTQNLHGQDHSSVNLNTMNEAGGEMVRYMDGDFTHGEYDLPEYLDCSPNVNVEDPSPVTMHQPPNLISKKHQK